MSYTSQPYADFTMWIVRCKSYPCQVEETTKQEVQHCSLLFGTTYTEGKNGGKKALYRERKAFSAENCNK